MTSSAVKRYGLVATGGTFDIIHRGHRALLSEAFSVSERVIIGLTGDGLAKRRGKILLNTYQQRLELLHDVLRTEFPGSRYVISRLDDDFGPAVLEEDVQALVVSQETRRKGDILNGMRRARGVRPVVIVVVLMVMASDGRRISTTRIRNSEIDSRGGLV